MLFFGGVARLLCQQKQRVKICQKLALDHNMFSLAIWVMVERRFSMFTPIQMRCDYSQFDKPSNQWNHQVGSIQSSNRKYPSPFATNSWCDICCWGALYVYISIYIHRPLEMSMGYQKSWVLENGMTRNIAIWGLYVVPILNFCGVYLHIYIWSPFFQSSVLQQNFLPNIQYAFFWRQK